MILIKCEESKKSKYDYELTVEYETGGLFSKKRTVRRVYVGECTVFHNIETGYRPGSFMEEELNALLWKWKYDNEKN